MQRVMIIGQPGAGKSTLARTIGVRTGLPVVHIDHIHWKPGWVERPRSEKTALCREVHARDAWVFEGGHSATWAERLARADTVIWLDYPVGTRLRRVILRSLRNRGRSRADLPDDCPEKINPDFYRWIWNTRHSGRLRIAAFMSDLPPGKAAFHLRGDAQVAAFLETAVPPAD